MSMATLFSASFYTLMKNPVPLPNHRPLSDPRTSNKQQIRHPTFKVCAAKSGLTSMVKGGGSCKTCKSKGAIECPGCKGTGRNKKNGNIFERWKCFECQGFGLKGCPSCGKGGLTPEQRGER